MQPYYDDGQITIYCGAAEDVLPALERRSVDLVLTDPPYGVHGNHQNATRGRSSKGSNAHDYPPVYGDTKPFDPSLVLRFSRLILFGANYYAEQLPPSPSWIVWDKLAGLHSKREWGFNDQADVELAWSNLGGPARIIPIRWLGHFRSATTEYMPHRWHPTQKPVSLMCHLIARFTEPGALILDPYMGSGTTLRAAKDLGRRAIGIEISEAYCAIAVRRLAQQVLPLDLGA